MKYGARREVVLEVDEPSVGRIKLGKIARRFQDGHWVYANHISAEMRKTGEFGVAPCVLALMRAWQVDGIMYYDARTQTTFVTNLYTLCAEGKLVGYSYRPQYWHLALGEWREIPSKLGTRWATEVMALEWENEAERAAAVRPTMAVKVKQMAMF